MQWGLSIKMLRRFYFYISFNLGPPDAKSRNWCNLCRVPDSCICANKLSRNFIIDLLKKANIYYALQAVADPRFSFEGGIRWP